MSTFVLFAAELYGLPILQPMAEVLEAAGHQVFWFLAGAANRATLNGRARLTDVNEVRALQPDAVFSAANWVPHFFPGLKVQLFHGFNVEKRSDNNGHFRIRGLFDLYCTQGPATTAPFQALAAEHGHFAVVETGWPKLDPLFSEQSGQRLELADEQRPVVMYAATFTERLSSAPILHDALRHLIARGDHYWLLTLHPKTDPALVRRFRELAGPHARFIEAEQIVMAQRAADMLVCDTSSVISEFVVQQKPVVTFRNRAPRAHMLDIGDPADLAEAIDTALARPPQLIEAVHAEAERIHPYRDGRSGERVLAAVETMLRGDLPVLLDKPRNNWRKWQMRWALGYFGAAGVVRRDLK